MNGGRECPPLIENRGCFRTQCGGRELGKHLVHSCKSHIFYIRKIFSKELSLIEIALIHVSQWFFEAESETLCKFLE